jgi:hypothetical protein
VVPRQQFRESALKSELPENDEEKKRLADLLHLIYSFVSEHPKAIENVLRTAYRRGQADGMKEIMATLEKATTGLQTPMGRAH